MKKVVVKLEFSDEKIRQKAMKTVSGISGVESISLDPKDKKLTVIGNVDPVAVVGKLRKLCRTDIVSVGPDKEPEKKKDEPKKEDCPKQVPAQFPKAYPGPAAYYQTPYYNRQYQPYQQTPSQQSYYNNRSGEEDPNGCIIS